MNVLAVNIFHVLKQPIKIAINKSQLDWLVNM